MSFNILRILSFFFFLILQGVLFKNVVLFHTAFCFIYILYILRFPVETNPLVLMLIAFTLGLGVDMFYDSTGLHAMASVFLAYLRKVWLMRITPQGGYDRNSMPTLTTQGLQWFLIYALPLVFMHHTVLFFTEAGSILYFWSFLLKIFASTLFTVVAMTIGQMLFSR